MLFSTSITSSWARSVEKQAILAVLTLNIARFTSWPDNIFNNTDQVLNLCVYGNNIVQQSFESINNKIIQNRTLHIINLSRLRNIDRCQLLYLSELNRNKLIPLLVDLKSFPILTVGENKTFLQSGGMVALENINGKIQISVNLTMVRQSELSLSSRLLKLVNIVNFPAPNK
ncbi:MAG: YfiR family protein [Methylococcales bacterium]|nr:YfiR family protein [Methylococcales bacterium]MCK5477793.1 YfiR family protein [Methylococcales bacterium]